MDKVGGYFYADRAVHTPSELALFAQEADSSSFRLDRHSIEQVMGKACLRGPERIQSAIGRADYQDAAVRALACAMLEISLPGQLIADVLVGVTAPTVFLALGRQISSDDVQLLLDLVQRGRLADNAAGAEQTALTLLLLWKLGLPDLHPLLVAHLRRLARSARLPLRAAGPVIWLARRLGNSHVEAIYAETHGAAISEDVVAVVGGLRSDMWGWAIGDMVALLPARADDAMAPGLPARTAPRPGRNEPCPCGSGMKFKRCCAEKPEMASISEASRIERLRRAEPHLDETQLAQLSRVDLALLNLARLQDAAVLEVMWKQVEFRDWKRVCLAFDELARRHGAERADGHLRDVIFKALGARLFDVAEKLLERLQNKTEKGDLRFELDLATRAPDALAKLEAAAHAALVDGRRATNELGFTIMEAMPALGILIARGAILVDDDKASDSASLLEAIEEARDLLLLPPGDPAQARYEALGGVRRERVVDAAEDHAQLARTAAELRAKLDHASERLAALQRQVDERERDLDRAERAAQEQSQRSTQAPADPRDRRILRDRIDELQARIREGNAERADLRRQLSQAAGGIASSGAAQAVTRRRPERDEEEDSEDADDAEPLAVVPTSRALAFPQFFDNAKAALASVPRDVATRALHIVADLAAGDPAAWSALKQAKNMRRQLLMARVGIHHRLLFRVEHNALEVIDLVTRESLMTTLKRLRAV